MRVHVVGAAGAGTTTLGHALAARRGLTHVDTDELPLFDLVVFLWVPADIRLARLRARERARYGDAVVIGGPLHDRSEAFVAWAAGYDEGLDVPERCRRLHETWLAALPCPVLRIEGAASVEANLELVSRSLG